MFFTIILILISFVAFKIHQSVKVPEGLKNVQALSFVELLVAIFTGAGPAKRWEGMRKVLEEDGIGRVNIFLRGLGLKENFLKTNF